MGKCIPEKSHVHATVRLARCSNSIKEIDEYSNAIDLIIFPENEEKQFGMCIGSPSDNSPCKYRSRVQYASQNVVEPLVNGCPQADGNGDTQTPTATVFIKPETNNNHISGSDNLTSGKIVEDIIAMESNKYDTANEPKEVSSVGLTSGKICNTANTLETIDSEILDYITKGGLQIAHSPAMPSPCPDTSSKQERITATMGSYRLGIFSKSSSSKKTKRKQKEVDHFSKPELSAGLNSDTLVGPRKGPKGNDKQDATEENQNAAMARLKI
jgi:hypothetical protein